MSEPKTSDVSKDPRWGFNPISRRYILRTGTIWRRLVKAGAVVDEEVAAQLAQPITGTRPRAVQPNNIVIEEGPPEAHVTRADLSQSRKMAKKLIAEHVDELEGLSRRRSTRCFVGSSPLS